MFASNLARACLLTCHVFVANLSRVLFSGSQVDICSETAYSERRSQSVANMKQKQRKGRRISRLFGSDNEEEVNSVVSDIPGMYGRSSSMVGQHNMDVKGRVSWIFHAITKPFEQASLAG